MALFDPHSVAGYTEAVAHEQTVRDAAFLDIPEWINGVPVQPLTLDLFNRLVAIRSPFVVGGGKFSAVDIGNFLWTMSPRWRPIRMRINRRGEPVATGFNILRKFLFLRQHRRAIVTTIRKDELRESLKSGRNKFIPCAETAVEIYSFINEAFYDAPSSNGRNKSKSYSSWNAILVHEFKKAYNWEPEKTLSVPVRVLFQLRKWIWRDINPKSPLTNPSDDILEKHFARLNGVKLKSAHATN